MDDAKTDRADKLKQSLPPGMFFVPLLSFYDYFDLWKMREARCSESA